MINNATPDCELYCNELFPFYFSGMLHSWQLFEVETAVLKQHIVNIPGVFCSVSESQIQPQKSFSHWKCWKPTWWERSTISARLVKIPAASSLQQHNLLTRCFFRDLKKKVLLKYKVFFDSKPPSLKKLPPGPLLVISNVFIFPTLVPRTCRTLCWGTPHLSLIF